MINKPFTIFSSFIFLMFSCDTSTGPYLKHKVQYEKLEGSCSQLDPKFSMVSNTSGERYEFQECLGTGYEGACNVERRGDTVVVQFPKTQGEQALYKITLDINTYPRYNFLTIGESTFSIIPARN